MSIISDATAALAQMQATVNEVLDFRAMDSGVGALKLNKQPVVLGEVLDWSASFGLNCTLYWRRFKCLLVWLCSLPPLR